MKRRSLFQLIACATACAAMEVCGLKPLTKAELEDLEFRRRLEEANRNLQRNVVTIWEDRYPHEFHVQNSHKIIGFP